MLVLVYSIVLKYLQKCLLVQILLIDMFMPIIEFYTNYMAIRSIKLVVLLNTSLVHFLPKKIYIHKTDSAGRNNEYMQHLHLYADEDVLAHVLDLTFTENQPT